MGVLKSTDLPAVSGAKDTRGNPASGAGSGIAGVMGMPPRLAGGAAEPSCVMLIAAGTSVETIRNAQTTIVAFIRRVMVLPPSTAPRNGHQLRLRRLLTPAMASTMAAPGVGTLLQPNSPTA